MLIQWGYKDLSIDADITIYIINYTSANSYTILTSISMTNNEKDKWDYPLCVYNRSSDSFTVTSKSKINGARILYFCIGY